MSSANASALGERLPVRTLGQDDFLKLVLVQLTHQDPLNPKQDTEFIAQLTQFSALEQAKAMQTDLAQLRAEQQFLQANGLLGRLVTLQDESGALTRGMVTGIAVEAGTPKLVINGRSFPMSQLLAVEAAATET